MRADPRTVPPLIRDAGRRLGKELNGLTQNVVFAAMMVQLATVRAQMTSSLRDSWRHLISERWMPTAGAAVSTALA